mmetsp:Transcript_36906/g.59116  ORF Transcript_36906/g.59116 Transcript_36906/m.59116 type:complete len:84 (+) Transcript_36906:105-356(+)
MKQSSVCKQQMVIKMEINEMSRPKVVIRAAMWDDGAVGIVSLKEVTFPAVRVGCIVRVEQNAMIMRRRKTFGDMLYSPKWHLE